MRYVEIMSGIRVQVSKEERAVLAKGDSNKIAARDLDERELELARQLVRKGLLNPITSDEELFYLPNTWID